jgi:oligopeptide transport system substrate-binding protein
MAALPPARVTREEGRRLQGRVRFTPRLNYRASHDSYAPNLLRRLMALRPVGTILSVALVLLLVAGCGGDEGGGVGSESAQVLRLNVGSEPPSLDPGLAVDVVSANVLNALMDPLVKLGDGLQPVPSLAESWDVSEDGKTVTFHMRSDGTWTNGDPVTAQDFEYSWKRTISPELAADYAYQFYGIVGAQDYNGCAKSCEALSDKVGVKALDDYTLEVKLTEPQPWFLQQMAHTSFLAVHRPTVEKYGDKWTEPENIVTDGPFKLQTWEHESSITLVKNEGWRDAASVHVKRVEGKMISDSTTALQAFEAGEIDACLDQQTCIPVDETERLKGEPVYHVYPGLGVQYIGVNVKNIPDVNERRALALAIDRTSIVENVTKGGEAPATSFTPAGMPGFDSIKQSFVPVQADLERAKQYMAQAENPKKSLTLYANQDALAKNVAVAVQAMWEELGVETTIKTLEWAQYLDLIGPPPNHVVDAYFIGWIGDYVDAINFLQLAECGSGFNSSSFCDPEFDKLLTQAKGTGENEERYGLYGEAESRITGEQGGMPFIPLYWITYSILSKEKVKDWKPNLLDQFDWTKVRVESS